MDRKFSPRFITRQDRVLAGEKRVVTVASPGAGQDWAVQVPGGRQWRLDTLSAVFTASAAVANRVPRLRLSDETTQFWQGGATAAIVASQVIPVSGSVLGPQGANAGSQFPLLVALPDVVLPTGTLISTSTFAIDAADQWSAIAFLVEEFWNSDQSLTNRHLAYDHAEAEAAAAALGQIGAI